MSIRLAMIGLGKIATDQHLPTLEATDRFELVATVDPQLDTDPSAHPATFASIDELIAADLDIQAVTLAVPPAVRHEMACRSLAEGWHVMLEKPPGITLAEVADLETRAQADGITLYASWHSRHAAAVDAARDWLADRRVTRMDIDWREDVTRTHPGQKWIWQPGGLGVFDPGINAFSIATTILPQTFALQQASLETPENCETPIAATLRFATLDGAPIKAVMDFRHTGAPCWDMRIATDGGELLLGEGGDTLAIDGDMQVSAEGDEYAGVYARFADLIDHGASDVDITPFRHVADAFLLGEHRRVAAFHE